VEAMIGVYAEKISGVWFGVACAEQHVYGTSFASSETEAVKSLLCSMPFNMPFQVFPAPSVFAEKVLSAVKGVYDGNGISQSFTLATEHLPDYTRRVLEVTSLVPVGYVTSYGSIAKAAGGSPRAVGNVMASNPFAPIVPCHRVVSANFALGGYGGGLDAKLEFLVREKRGYTCSKDISVEDKKLQVFPVEYVVGKIRRKG
jgi:methylated-DNA-[protein]-cysteine S-methyltransferase